MYYTPCIRLHWTLLHRCGAGSYSRKLKPREVPFLPSNLSYILVHYLTSTASYGSIYGFIIWWLFLPSNISPFFYLHSISSSIIWFHIWFHHMVLLFNTLSLRSLTYSLFSFSPQHPHHLVAGVKTLFTICVLCTFSHDAPDSPIFLAYSPIFSHILPWCPR